ncbi:MAG: glycosyltransferase family 4 protein [Flavobacteriia bacterium]|nr:glycosyltransferase family 4 protein [Flavobacteriia bacterium]
MKILLIHQYFLEKDDPGGSRFNEMTKSWVEAGHEVVVLAGTVNYITGKVPEQYRGKSFKWVEYQENLNVLRCKVSENYNANFIGRLWAYFSFVFYSILGGLFKLKFKPDVIVVTSPPLFVGITAVVLRWFKRVPYVFEVRDLWPESAIDSGVVKNKLIIKLAYFFEGYIYKRARLINVLTPAFKKKLIENKNVPENKVIFIPNAADFRLSDTLLSSFDPDEFRAKHGMKDKFVVTYVGAHGVANHLWQLLDAAELLMDSNVVIQLVGGGMEKDKLKESAAERQLTNVVFVDPVPKAEVFKYILASDVGASVLKKVDTFKTIYSNKTFDYMACKRPVLLCIDGVSRELVENANCGVFAEPENAVEIAKKIRYLKDEVNDLSAMGLNGYNYAKQHFDRQVLAELYTQALSEVKNG